MDNAACDERKCRKCGSTEVYIKEVPNEDFDFRIVDIFKRQAEAEKKFTELKDIVIKGS